MTAAPINSPFGGSAALLSVVAAAAALATPCGAVAQGMGSGAGFEPTSATAVIVKVPKPWYAPAAVVVGRMRDSAPQYDALPGLSYKVFTLAQADGGYGGVYLWKDVAGARGFFSPAWFERIERERGAKGDVRYFEVPVAIDNTPGGTPSNLDSTTVVTLVTLATPAGVSKQRLIKEFEASVPLYQKVPGLLRKYFVLTESNEFGGIYVFKDKASESQWFNAAWKERVNKTYGVDATLERFDAPILLPSKIAANKPSVPGL